MHYSWGLGFLASDSNAAQNTPSSRIIQGISYLFAGFSSSRNEKGKNGRWNGG